MHLDFYSVIRRELKAVQQAEKEPEQAIIELYNLFPELGDISLSRIGKKELLLTTITRMKARGDKTAEIAKRLGISARHIRRLCAQERLNARQTPS